MNDVINGIDNLVKTGQVFYRLLSGKKSYEEIIKERDRLKAKLERETKKIQAEAEIKKLEKQLKELKTFEQDKKIHKKARKKELNEVGSIFDLCEKCGEYFLKSERHRC